jgi:hypothetical protein
MSDARRQHVPYRCSGKGKLWQGRVGRSNWCGGRGGLYLAGGGLIGGCRGTWLSGDGRGRGLWRARWRVRPRAGLDGAAEPDFFPPRRHDHGIGLDTPQKAG